MTSRASSILLRRRLTNAVALGACWAMAFSALIPLLFLLWHVLLAGAGSLGAEFFTQRPRPPGETGGGMQPAIVGSLMIVGIAAAIGLPVGILGGLYLAEYPDHRLTQWIRYAADVLSGIPSIVLGVTAYVLVVVPTRRFSATAGGLALALIMVPIVLRTTEEMLRLVPGTLREASLALGAPRWRTALQVVLPAAAPGVLTGVLLAVARVAGETAPLIFTAFGNDRLNLRLNQPTASLPVQIYTFATSPTGEWHRLAWGGALLLILTIALLSLSARLATGRQGNSE